MKWLTFLILTAALLSGCSNPPENPPATTPVPAPTPTPAPTPATRPEITVDSVAAANPLVVRGHARTFENSVALRARDAAGEVIGETFTTSAGEMGRHNPYEAQLWLVRHPGARVTAEAFEYSAKDGSVQKLASRTVDYPVEPIGVTLVFPKGDCTQLASFRRDVPKTPAMARLLVEALLSGPTPSERAAGASSPFPRGSAVLSVNLRDGTLTIDFNDRLRNVGGSCAAQAIRDSVTRTLTQLPSVKEVVITAAGSRELALQP